MGTDQETVLLTAAVVAVVAVACGGEQSVLDPGGPDAERLAGLWWFILWLGAAVFVIVMTLAVVPGWRSWRRWRDRGRATAGDAGDVEPEERTGELGYRAAHEEPHDRALVWGVGLGLPAVVLVVLMIVSAPVGPTTAPMRPADDPDPLTIEVVGHMFWWEVTYPEQGVRTANEIHIPAGEQVQLRLSSEDVIHSFWVPQLAGKIDLTPGHETSLLLEADEPGTYRGQCAEYCGLSHALMAVHVVAEDPDGFQGWIDAQLEPADPIVDDRIREGQRIFAGASCVHCHSVRGHSGSSEVGPDLTHLMSREHIAAGRLPNTRGHLAEWILEPQTLKPGNGMPPAELEGESLELLLDYLESLE